MATVTGPDGVDFDVDDSNTVLLTYYRAEGYPIDGVTPQVDWYADADVPVDVSDTAPGLGIYQGDPVELEQLPDGQDVVVGAPAPTDDGPAPQVDGVDDFGPQPGSTPDPAA